MSLNDLHSKYEKADILLHKNKPDEALEELTYVINSLIQNKVLIQNEEARDLLTVSCIKRVDLFYEKKKFQEMLFDIQILEEFDYDIYSDPELFLKKQEGQSEIHRNYLDSEFQKFKINSMEIDKVKENIKINFNIKKMFSRMNEKPNKRVKN